MSDLIQIVDLQVWTHIGVGAEERLLKQKLFISVNMWVPSFKEAALVDDVSKTVNYYAVCRSIKKMTQERPRKLIETLAHDLAEGILSDYPIEKIRIDIKKMIIPETRHVGVEIFRTLADFKKE